MKGLYLLHYERLIPFALKVFSLCYVLTLVGLYKTSQHVLLYRSIHSPKLHHYEKSIHVLTAYSGQVYLASVIFAQDVLHCQLKIFPNVCVSI